MRWFRSSVANCAIRKLNDLSLELSYGMYVSSICNSFSDSSYDFVVLENFTTFRFNLSSLRYFSTDYLYAGFSVFYLIFLA